MYVAATALVVAALVGLYLYQKNKGKVRPHGVIHYGTPPPGIDIALETIFTSCPELPRSGIISWEERPFRPNPISSELAMGTVLMYKPFWHIRVTWDSKVERTALAHELGHVWSELTAKGFGESPQDKKFVEWFTDINTQIARKLGR